MIDLGAMKIETPVFLAPLAGITDLPFRNLVTGFGAGLVVSEMIASQDMVIARAGSREKAELGLGFEKTAVQLAGREAFWMREAARMVEDQGARMIDINMGCPAKKVVSGYSGSALLKDLDHALRLIEAVVQAVNLPVSLKTRLGWDDNLLEFLRQSKIISLYHGEIFNCPDDDKYTWLLSTSEVSGFDQIYKISDGDNPPF